MTTDELDRLEALRAKAAGGECDALRAEVADCHRRWSRWGYSRPAIDIDAALTNQESPNG